MKGKELVREGLREAVRDVLGAISVILLMLVFLLLSVLLAPPAAGAEAEWLGEDRPLDEGAHRAQAAAEGWMAADQYPVREGAAVTYLYGAGQPDVVCAPLHVCVIELEAGERVVADGVQIGDTVRWRVSPTVGAGQRTHLVVKPIDVGLETTMAVVTDRRSYNVRLLSRLEDYMPMVRWAYPEDSAAAWARYHAVEVEQAERETLPETADRLPDLHFGYRLRGCERCRWRPLRVYDDGARTVIQMPGELRQTDAPVLMIETGGERELVNYRLLGDRYIVDQVIEAAVMLSGVGRRQERVEIERL